MLGGRFGWRQAPLLSHSTCKAEHAGRCRRRGETRLPESDHTTAKVAPIVAGTEKPPWDVCCVGLSQPPQLCHEHLAAMTLHLPPLSSLWDIWICRCSTEMADPGHGPRKARTVGSRSRQGKNTGTEETVCTLQEKAQGCGPQPSFHPPLEGLELLFTQRWKGKGVEEQHPATPQAHRNTLTPKAPPPVGHHHIQGQTTTPRPHHGPPCLLTPPTATLWPLHQRDRAGGEERGKGGHEGRGTAQGRRREPRTAIHTTTSRR